MNIEEAKSIQLEDYLRRMGFNPVKQQGDSIWYCSPFREEKTPSFKVNTTATYGMTLMRPYRLHNKYLYGKRLG